ncbi:Ras-related protein Rab-19 [Manis javanica]|nr:Ras-related protein Rab-19 [Manis javanica]
MNVSREAGFARRALASASPACPQPAAPAEFRGAGRVRTFLSLSQAAQPDTWGQDYRSHHACEAGGRRGTEGRKGKQGEEENLTCWQRSILGGKSHAHFKSGVYTETQQNTIGVDFTVRSLEIDGKKVKMQVWDTAGQERFRTITQSYYRSAHAAIIAYDLTRQSTFESIPHWIHEIEKYGAANLVIMLIGNKCDMWEKRHVLFEDACTLAEKYGLLAVLETSAKESKNIDEVFVLMARELIARNSLHLCGENALNNLPLDSSPVLMAQVPSEKTQCTC